MTIFQDNYIEKKEYPDHLKNIGYRIRADTDTRK